MIDTARSSGAASVNRSARGGLRASALLSMVASASGAEPSLAPDNRSL